MTALSQKTLYLDTIMVETLYNRGVPLSTSQTYIATVSPFGPYTPPVPVSYTTIQSVAEIITITSFTTLPCTITLDIELSTTSGIAINSNNTIYISEYNRILTLTTTGAITRFIGSTLSGYSNGNGTNVRFHYPQGVAVDSRSNIYVADSGNNAIRMIYPNGTVSTLVGNGPSGNGFSNGNGTNARFYKPTGVSVDSSSNIYVADSGNNAIRIIYPGGAVSTLAGSTNSGFSNGNGTNAYFSNPSGIAIDSYSNVYVADTGNNAIRIIYPGGAVSTLSGNGSPGFTDGNGTNVSFFLPYGVALDSNSNVYVADSGNCAIRILYQNGTVSTLAGSPLGIGFVNGTGTTTQFSTIRGVAIDTRNNVYVTDTGNNAIRKILPPYTYSTETITQSTIQTTIPQYVQTIGSCECTPITKPSLAQYLQWTNQPLSTIYYPFFYGVNPQDLVDQLADIKAEGAAAVQAYTIATQTIGDLSTTTIYTYSNIDYANSSTISSYSTSFTVDSNVSIDRYNTAFTALQTASTAVVTLSTIVYPYFFVSYANTLSNRGDFYYLVRPDPLPSPAPWYWQGLPERYIGPGLSSMYVSTVLNQPLIDSYVNLLSNTSTSGGILNTTTIDNVNSYIAYTNTAAYYIDSGSSISTTFGDSCSTFEGHLVTDFYGTDVSTISTYVTDYFSNYSVPTNGPYISTGASSMFLILSTLNSTTIGHISSGLLIDPTHTFSTIEVFEIASVITTLYTRQNYPTLSSLNSTFMVGIVPVANALSLSTNVAGYQNLSTVAYTMVSSFSTIFPLILGKDTLYNTSSFNSTVKAFSSILVPQNSTIYGLNSQYIAAPGVSSLNSNLSTYTEEYYTIASAQISSLSTILQYSTVIYQANLNMAAVWYSSITVIPDYSTTHATYFQSIRTEEVKGVSSIIRSSLGVQIATPRQGLAVQGGVRSLGTITLPNFSIYATNSDVPYTIGTKCVQSKVSNIIFNSTFTIRQPLIDIPTITPYSTLIGINTTTPAYALDVVGYARKQTGTQWINPSDERVKTRISDVDYDTIIRQISSLRLVSFTWSDQYRAAHDLPSNRILGFLSQEVESVFPGAVFEREEEGFSDFKSLDTDQLMKTKFAMTRHLLFRVSTLQTRLNNLMRT